VFVVIVTLVNSKDLGLFRRVLPHKRAVMIKQGNAVVEAEKNWTPSSILSGDAGTKPMHTYRHELCGSTVDIVFRIHFGEFDYFCVG
jgi:hypothetical protein